eukprot:TRINITY_DN5964_c0_g1_i1.p1 TRINITY_DN5964_c0_g1~~TRINITY_DN5964_c0_g1_i1.p1  ORF type:complete len:475 (-),score=63.29 TRINITY_DN5964_c0_g1_i1:80-1504(-)
MCIRDSISYDSIKTRLETTCKIDDDVDEKSLEFAIRNIHFSSTNCLLIIIKDVTHIKQVARLKALDQYKDQLLASVTHELRTPLNCIIPMINDVMNDPTIPEASKETSLKPALNSAQLLMNIVNDILDYSRYKRNKLALNFGEFDLHERMMEIYRLFELQCKHKGLELILDIHSDVPRLMYSDKNRLGQVIINFLSNSLKFTSRGSIRIFVQPSNTNSDSLLFKVSDTGVGIKIDQLGKLFTEFGKIEASENINLNPQGVGLGLMISNQLVTMLGGKAGIKASSNFGEGSEFSFELPLQPPLPIYPTQPTQRDAGEVIIVDVPSNQLQNPKQIGSACECRRILSVDDNDYNQMVIERMLKRLKIDVVKSFNGADALKLMTNPSSAGLKPCQMPTCTYFSLVVTDLQMPVMDGLELIKEIRSMPDLIGKIPIILVSATGDEMQVKEGFNAGMNDFLCKPLTDTVLKDSLKAYNLS